MSYHRKLTLQSLPERLPAEEAELQALLSYDDEVLEAEAAARFATEQEEKRVRSKRRAILSYKRWTLTEMEEAEYKELHAEWIAECQQNDARALALANLRAAEEERIQQRRRNELESKERNPAEEAELFMMRENEAHHMAYANGHHPQEVDLYSSAVPVYPTAGPTISSRRWRVEQENRACAALGSVHEVKTAFAMDNTLITYALMRIPTAARWVNLALHYTHDDRISDMIKAYVEKESIPVAPHFVEAPQAPIAWVQLQPEQTWAVAGSTTLTHAQ